MSFGQHFKVGVLEKLRLTFIMNFFEFHAAKIGKQPLENADLKLLVS